MTKKTICFCLILLVFLFNAVNVFAWFTAYDTRTLSVTTGIFAKPYLTAGEDFNRITSPLKSGVTSIEFVSKIPDLSAYEMGKTKFDVSKEQDGSAMAWADGTSMYIGGRGGVIADVSCDSLFSGYEKVTKIQFKGLLDTTETTSAGSMFLSCKALVTADFNTLDTSSIQNFRLMLADCTSIQNLDISAWDVSSAKNMYGMFLADTSLYSVNMGVKDATGVLTFENMFSQCRNLISLDLSHFTTRDAVCYDNMFLNTRVSTLDLSGFQMTENATLSQMFGFNTMLSTIYASSNWSEVLQIPSIPFWMCRGLTGSNTSEAEGIDMADYNTGYFTYKAYAP